MSVRDHVRRNSLELEVLKRARTANLAGATVFEAIEGFGASGRVHRERFLSDDRPIAVVLIDEPGKIAAFLDELTPLLSGVVVVLDEVEIIDLGGPPDPG